MSDDRAIALTDRAVILLGGEDPVTFLQGLVTSDMDQLAAGNAAYAALLTPQGKILHDFFVVPLGNGVGLDVGAAGASDLVKRLTLYRLRAKITIEPAGDSLAVFALTGDSALKKLGLDPSPGAAQSLAGGIVYTDPRLPALGARAVLPTEAADNALSAAGFVPGKAEDYDAWRMQLGVPEGSRDFPEGIFALEAGLADLHGVDFDKGCYVGQEVTTRMQSRALVRKRLVPVTFEGPPPATGTPVTRNGSTVGEMRAAFDGAGMALLRLDALGGDAPLMAGDVRLTPRKPDWATF